MFSFRRVKLPKTFLAVNLSDAFTFEEQERLASDHEGLEMKAIPPKDLLTGGGEPVPVVESQVVGSQDAESQETESHNQSSPGETQT